MTVNARASEDWHDARSEDPEIEPERLMVYVVEVELNPFGPWETIPSEHLSETR
jgi:hypothetical protein